MAPKIEFACEKLGIIDNNLKMDSEFDIIGKNKTSSFASIAEHIKHRLNVYG